MKLQPGDKAPDFNLRNTEKEVVSLSDFHGQKVVLVFFPLAFSSTCTEELCQIRDEKSIFEDLNAQILAISVDSFYSLRRYKDDQSLNFVLLSDFNKEVSRAYGTLYEDFFHDMKGVSKRSAFVIDKTGTIQYAEVLEIARDLPDFEKIKEALQSLH